MSNLNAPHFQHPDKAREYLEALRWPNGPVCPHCGATEGAYRLAGQGGKKGTKARPGLLKCGACRKQFSVTVGTVFERSKIPLNVWLQATYLLCSSKKGMSAHQLHRTLGVTYKTAWFMAHRIREAMRELDPTWPPLGGEGKTVESDETYIGPKTKYLKGVRKIDAIGRRWAYVPKQKVVTLVERGGKLRSTHVADVTAETLRPILWGQIHRLSNLRTDEHTTYQALSSRFASHETVNHSIEEYVRGDAHVNTCEGYFALLKRGIYGVYQHVSSAHLKRYVGEFDFRYNHRKVTDGERADEALRGIEGKRLTYTQPSAG
jgi:transposase-like protein